jgi:hypothetical protein
MIVLKIIFCVMICVPLACVGWFLFEKLLESATGGRK